MKKARKKPLQNGNRREDLLRVCARLFREQGFDGTSIRDISDAAGMHAGSPCYHV
jgi:AcrR family transcriptional regulator